MDNGKVQGPLVSTQYSRRYVLCRTRRDGAKEYVSSIDERTNAEVTFGHFGYTLVLDKAHRFPTRGGAMQALSMRIQKHPRLAAEEALTAGRLTRRWECVPVTVAVERRLETIELVTLSEYLTKEEDNV